MLIQLATILYVLVAIAMIALILMQRGGAGAGAGFGGGGGASATVFGARGASNFLSKSTKWLAILFFALSLGMAWYATKGSRPQAAQPSSIMDAVQQVPGAGIPQAAGQASEAAQPVPVAEDEAVEETAPVEEDPAQDGGER